MNKIKCLGILATLMALSFSAESVVAVKPLPIVAKPLVPVVPVAPVSLRIEDWCQSNYPSFFQRCLDGYYVGAYPAGIIWGTYGTKRDYYRRHNHWGRNNDWKRDHRRDMRSDGGFDRRDRSRRDGPGDNRFDRARDGRGRR